MWFQKRKPAQNVSLKKILSKRFSQKFLSSVKRGPAPPHPNSKCGFKRGNLPKTFLSKRFSQKFLSSVKRGPAPPSPKFEMWFQKRKPAQNVSLKKILSKRFSQNDSLKTILSKRFSQNLLAPKPLTISINHVVSKEEICPKRFSQKDSLKNFSLLSNEAPPPLTQIRNVVSKEETCSKRFSQKESLKKILSKRFSQNLLAPKPLTISINAAPTDKNLPPPMIYHRNFNDKQIEKGLEFRVY